MFSKRKSEEIHAKNAKKTMNFSLYIERERVKMVLEEESSESIQNYLSEKLRSLETSNALSFDSQTGWISIGPNKNIYRISRRPFGVSYSLPSPSDLNLHPHVRDTAVRKVSDCVNLSNSIFLLRQLINLVREWDFLVYKNCIGTFDVLRRNSLFWNEIILKALSSAMLQHHVKANIVADFFHIMCKDFIAITALAKIKPSYLQFFLMNMAAVNRIECSLVVETDEWNSAKRKLIERAFVAGQVSNLKLLLQYFQPADLWSNTDMTFLKVSCVNSEARAYNMDSILSGYYNNLVLLNLVRVATYVSESEVPKDILGNCIRLFWRASKMPYASLVDIENAFKPLCQSLLLRHTLMRAFKNPLLEAYPMECLMEYQPRSLMHLSRCKIRQTIASVVFLPSLPLPSRLKCYLNLDL